MPLNKKGKKIIWWLIEANKITDTETVTMLINNTWNYTLENRANFSIFNDKYIENYSFEEIAWISKNYKNDIKLSNGICEIAEVVELVDTLAWGVSDLSVVPVQVRPSAPIYWLESINLSILKKINVFWTNFV